MLLVLVVRQPKMCDQVLPHDVAKSVLKLHGLDKQVVLWYHSRRRIRILEIEAQPLLDAQAPQALGSRSEIQEQDEVKRKGRSKNRIPA